MLRLRFRRLERRLTQETVAEQANLHRPVLSCFESARLIPRPAELARLASVLGVQPPEALMEQVSDHWPTSDSGTDA